MSVDETAFDFHVIFAFDVCLNPGVSRCQPFLKGWCDVANAWDWPFPKPEKPFEA
jgi:hypothetical protein